MYSSISFLPQPCTSIMLELGTHLVRCVAEKNCQVQLRRSGLLSLFENSICLSDVWPGASPQDSQQLQWECPRYKEGWSSSTRQSAFPVDTQLLYSCYFEWTWEFQWKLVTVLQERATYQRLDVAHCAGTSGPLGLQEAGTHNSTIQWEIFTGAKFHRNTSRLWRIFIFMERKLFSTKCCYIFSLTHANS